MGVGRERRRRQRGERGGERKSDGVPDIATRRSGRLRRNAAVHLGRHGLDALDQRVDRRGEFGVLAQELFHRLGQGRVLLAACSSISSDCCRICCWRSSLT